MGLDECGRWRASNAALLRPGAVLMAALLGCQPTSEASRAAPMTDAGDGGAARAVEAGPDCGGTPFSGICWYLAADGESCDSACAVHGGFDPMSAAIIGTPEQGGSLEQCASVLVALRGNPEATVEPTIETHGIGCHLYGSAEHRWWLSEPAFAPDTTWAHVQIVCGCVE